MVLYMNMRLQHQYFNSTGVQYTVHTGCLYTLGVLGVLGDFFAVGDLASAAVVLPRDLDLVERGILTSGLCNKMNHVIFSTLQTIRFPFSNPIQFTIILNHASKTLPVVFNLANKHECTGTGTCYRVPVPVPNVRYNMFKFNICRDCI